ncbi:mitogen-activated protein kinase kinase kinase 5-like isoform X2 [Salvia miltiorrhiza]|uniref:mitogen-activated protein kinase kinase kinase 5-like isoform X2 n=1 Tax=Salvia miltiorrhiza TaxID=226208 RepID=UPI0025ACD5AB|nr:mitogen-activated protein kinase kinase kinase 5-like isoform X2 [Salvia miltiorrhiza]
MPNWWQGAFTSISKSQSRDDSVIPSTNGKPGFFSSRRHRILTRAKKLLQPLDAIDVGSPEKFRNQSVRPAAPAAASPLPLPLPELHVLLQRDPKLHTSTASTSGSVPLPSPDVIKVHRLCDDKERETAEATNGEAVDGHDVDKRKLVGEGSRRYSEVQQQCKKSPHNKTTSMESYGNNPCTSTSSAPCSPFSSTELSPARNDMWGAYYPTTTAGLFLVWSAPETSEAHHKHATSFDASPLPSPVHPLPLPPSVSMPAFPTPISPVGFVPDLSSLPPQSMPVSLQAAKNDFLAAPEPIKSKWQKGKLIGRGTFGSVYVASNRETGALCAMKEVEMLPDDSKSAECIRQLEQEIKVLSRLKHPNIVQYYGSEIIGDKFYIYLEYVHPGSINKFIHDHCGAITESVVRNFTRHILFGLSYLHGKKTIHRDIKGANLLVDAYGVVKLADFGMAKHLKGQTANLSLKGSPYWMAPELLQSAMQTDASWDMALAVDIWSLGCTIIEMMNGKPPWSCSVIQSSKGDSTGARNNVSRG